MGITEDTQKQMRLKRSGLTGDMVDDIDDLASEFPALTLGQGIYYASGGGSISMASLSMQVPSGKLFHLKNIDYIFGMAMTNPVILYDGPGVSAPKYFLYAGSASVFKHIDGIFGVVFQSIPMFGPSCSATAAFIKIGGLIRERLAEA